jgi:hypothetical protein
MGVPRARHFGPDGVPGHGHGCRHQERWRDPDSNRSGRRPRSRAWTPSPPAYGETRTRTGDTTIFSCATRASEFARFAGKSVASGAVSWFRAFPDFAVVSRRLRQTAAPVCLFAGPAHSCSRCGRLNAVAEPRGHGPPGPVVAGEEQAQVSHRTRISRCGRRGGRGRSGRRARRVERGRGRRASSSLG